MKNDIPIVIPLCNRPIFENMLNSLLMTENIEKCNLLFFDSSDTDYFKSIIEENVKIPYEYFYEKAKYPYGIMGVEYAFKKFTQYIIKNYSSGLAFQTADNIIFHPKWLSICMNLYEKYKTKYDIFGINPVGKNHGFDEILSDGIIRKNYGSACGGWNIEKMNFIFNQVIWCQDDHSISDICKIQGWKILGTPYSYVQRIDIPHGVHAPDKPTEIDPDFIGDKSLINSLLIKYWHRNIILDVNDIITLMPNITGGFVLVSNGHTYKVKSNFIPSQTLLLLETLKATLLKKILAGEVAAE